MLTVDNLTKRYGDVVALDAATFRAERGRIVGFLGPNGAGKTTAMRCIFGLVDPDAGSVEWEGRPIGRRDRVRFGYMPEERGLYPKMRVRQQLVHFARLSGVGATAEEAADRWLAALGLSDRADAKLEQLSHGNQQRVQLAVALVHDPELVVLDEPFAGLDPLGIEALSQVLRRLASDGVAVVFSSHQLDLVEDVCEDVAIIDRGRVVLTGTLAELRSTAGTRRLEVTVDGAAWVPPAATAQVLDRGTRHCVVDRDVDVAGLLAAARADGHVDRFVFEPPTLSDLFRQAVGS